MIRKLRIKLILAAMASLLIVLFIIMASVSILNYNKLVADADQTLALLAENGGFFPSPPQKAPKDGRNKAPHLLSPELPYETRYFFATLNQKGEVVLVNTGKIAAVDTSTAILYAQTVWQGGDSHGFMKEYRYWVESAEEETMVLFLDCSRSLDSFKMLLVSCAGVSLAGSLLVLLLLIFLSGRIMKPFLDNYEKQKRFITDAGHELKTPLTIIAADTEILEMDQGSNEWLRDIQSQTKRLAELTHDLILLSRMEEDQPKTQMLDLPLSDLVEESIVPFQAVAKTQNKTIQYQVAPLVSLRGDEKALRKLLSILLDNAVKYSPEGGEISCLLEKNRNTIRLRLENPAPGVSKEQTEHFFDRFYRGDSSRSSSTGGYGLGLSIAGAIVSAHKGRITAAVENGTLAVTVIFPAAP